MFNRPFYSGRKRVFSVDSGGNHLVLVILPIVFRIASTIEYNTGIFIYISRCFLGIQVGRYTNDYVHWGDLISEITHSKKYFYFFYYLMRLYIKYVISLMTRRLFLIFIILNNPI